jgi:putative oxidoreductase
MGKFVIILRLLLGGILFYAGFVKLNAGHAFAETIANFALLPAQANQILAVTLPWCELAAGLLLVFGVWVRASAIVAALFFAAFTAAIISALARGLDIECGCFGTDSGSRTGMKALAIDVALLALALLAVKTGAETQPEVRAP